METNTLPRYDVVVVGAGFAGLFMLHRVRAAGMSAHLFEAGAAVGGTWYWNRYPGARCDFESLDYSYSFDEDLQQEWNWRERYSGQREIQRYLDHVTDRYELRPHISFRTRIAGARFDEDDQTWVLADASGLLARARHVVMATGSLSTPRLPDIPGVETFAGRSLHTGAWPEEEVEFTDRRVAVIGTGSSGVQVSVEIAKQADQLYVVQRTPSYVVPAAHEPLDPDVLTAERGRYAERRALARKAVLGVDFATRPEPTLSLPDEEVRAEFDRRWAAGGAALLAAFPDLIVDAEANAKLAGYIKGRVREIVKDPGTADALSCQDYPVGARRLVVGPGFYEMFNQPNVALVDVERSPIEEITETGIRTADGFYEVDDIVYATGFDAMTGALLAMDIRGRGGRSLAEHWAAGPVTYLGLQAAGFPNMFFITGPGSPSVFSNMVHSIEQHVQFVGDLLVALRDRGASTVEPTAEAEAQWVEHVNEVAGMTLLPKAASWYMGANVPGKPRVFMPYVGGVPAYREICDEVASNQYEGLLIA
jgi:cyclohexanone monooxygenase